MTDDQGFEREQAIRETAYSLWQKAGMPNDRGMEFWLQATDLVDANAEAIEQVSAPAAGAGPTTG